MTAPDSVSQRPLALSENLFRFEDTCCVYVLRRGDEAVLIDFGTGAVLDALAELGITRVAAVLMTHHHRDQGQGLPHAVAIAFEVDGKRVLVTGDQYQNDAGDKWNYVYQNRFSPGDYQQSAALYRRLQPDLILTGHWAPYWVEPGYFDQLDALGEALAQLHAGLLPLEALDFGDSGFIASLEPYQTIARPGERLTFNVETRNPFPHTAEAVVKLVAPTSWQVEPAESHCPLRAHATATHRFYVTPPPGLTVRRARLAADITLNGQPFGQQAEALVTLTD